MAGDFDRDALEPADDAGSKPFRTRHDWTDGDDIAASVIEAVAAVVGKQPTDIEPLYEVVDPDALEELLLSLRSSGKHDRCGAVTFVFNDCEIKVEASGTIWIEPQGSQAPMHHR
jgi:hypothetical protein